MGRLWVNRPPSSKAVGEAPLINVAHPRSKVSAKRPQFSLDDYNRPIPRCCLNRLPVHHLSYHRHEPGLGQLQHLAVGHGGRISAPNETAARKYHLLVDETVQPGRIVIGGDHAVDG